MNAFVWRDYLLMEDVVYKIRDNLKIDQIDDLEILNHLKDRILNYRLISQYVCQQNKWIPDSIFVKYSDINYILKSKSDFELVADYESVYAGNLISNSDAFSGKKALTNSEQQYLNLIKDLSLDCFGRVRLKLRFAIKSKGGSFPSLVISQKEITDQLENEILTKTFLLNESNPDFVKSDKEGWYFFEFGFWFDKSVHMNSKQKIDVYLFDNSARQFFVDDLEIELRVF
ncbi:MAG: hypothetical protein IPG07_09990 [Crocinitomicaceae bacterium]|nr:hypothetical protein [Crocinitomicaceae bacterium]